MRDAQIAQILSLGIVQRRKASLSFIIKGSEGFGCGSFGNT